MFDMAEWWSEMDGMYGVANILILDLPMFSNGMQSHFYLHLYYSSMSSLH